ncbi:MAG: transposase, partial [Gammaproteobacteria bacterium HGW-Gammaproteobacteria-7]
MDLTNLFASFTRYLHSDSFLEIARHPAHPNAFSRQRKLPLPSLVAALVSGFAKSVQAELDEFFAHLQQQACLVRHVSEQAFAQARAKLSHTALPALNAQLLRMVDEAGGVPRWRGLRRIAVDGSVLRFGLRASHVPRAASRDGFLLGCYLPDAQLMLAATLHSACTGERQALFEQLDSF